MVMSSMAQIDPIMQSRNILIEFWHDSGLVNMEDERAGEDNLQFLGEVEVEISLDQPGRGEVEVALPRHAPDPGKMRRSNGSGDGSRSIIKEFVPDPFVRREEM